MSSIKGSIKFDFIRGKKFPFVHWDNYSTTYLDDIRSNLASHYHKRKSIVIHFRVIDSNGNEVASGKVRPPRKLTSRSLLEEGRVTDVFVSSIMKIRFLYQTTTSKWNVNVSSSNSDWRSYEGMVTQLSMSIVASV